MGSGIESQIRTYVDENLLFDQAGIEYGNDTSFLQTGLIDSMGVMELVSFVGSNFQLQVDPIEVTPENFDSVNRLAEYVRRKSQANGAAQG